MAAKPTNAERQSRINEVIGWIASGWHRQAIIRYVSEKMDWNVSDRTIDAYLKAAYEHFRQLADFRKEEEIGKAIRMLETAIAANIKGNDWMRAISARRELNQLLGLYAPPAVQTLKIQGIDLDMISQLADAAEAAGLSPSELFNSLLAEIATARQEQKP